MKLDEAQSNQVIAWIAQGLKLADIQKKLAAELGVHLTYIEVRMLVDDLKLVPKDPEPTKPPEALGSNLGAAATPALQPKPPGPKPPEAKKQGARGAGALSVTVDHVARPGAVVSGNVTFSDGNSAQWYLDQFGRLGLVPKIEGYRPAPEDLQAFQTELQQELAKLGF
jgi:hypothetical protein